MPVRSPGEFDANILLAMFVGVVAALGQYAWMMLGG